MVKLARSRTVLVLLAAAFFLAACGSLDYTRPVAAFSGAVDAAGNSFDEAQTAVEAQQRRQAIAAALANPRSVRFYTDGATRDTCAEKDSGSQPGRCRLVVDVKGRPQPLSFSDPSLDFRFLIAPLRAYAANLVEIAKADNSGEVASAVATAGAQTRKLAKTIDAFEKSRNPTSNTNYEAKASAYIGPVSNAFTFGAALYTSSLKRDALRKATDDMEKTLTLVDLSRVLAAVVKTSVDIQRADIEKRFNVASEKWDDERDGTPRLATLEAYIAATQAYDRILIVNEAKAFEELQEAHRQLTLFLENGDENSGDFWSHIDSALTEINKIAEIAEEFKAAHAATQKRKPSKKEN